MSQWVETIKLRTCEPKERKFRISEPIGRKRRICVIVESTFSQRAIQYCSRYMFSDHLVLRPVIPWQAILSQRMPWDPSERK